MIDIELQTIEGPQSGNTLELEGPAVIGRSPGEGGLTLEDSEASRRHASLIPEGRSLNVEDLGSTNGTFVNGERISDTRILVPGDRLRIGSTVLEVCLVGSAATGARAAAGHDDSQAAREVAPPLAAVSGGSPDEEPPGSPAGGTPPEEPPAQPPAVPEPVPEPLLAPPPPPGGAPAPDAPLPPPPPPPTSAPPGAPPSYPPVAYGGESGYPIDFQVDYPEAGIARWRPFFHGLLAIPHMFVLLFLYLGLYLAYIGAWFGILFTGRYPKGIFDYIAGVQRWSNRVTAYYYFMTEEYPPFSLDEEAQYPARTKFQYPPDGKIDRWRVFFQWILAIPHFIIVSFLFMAEYIILVVAWFAVVFTKKWPRGLFEFTVGLIRWRQRASGYGYFLMTEEYPPFSLEP